MQTSQGQKGGTVFMEMRNLICKAETIKQIAETDFCEIALVFSNQICPDYSCGMQRKHSTRLQKKAELNKRENRFLIIK